MNLFSLVGKEILRRKAGFALACGAVALAAAGAVFTETVSRALVDAMRRITVGMGTNILVLPAGTDANAFWSGQTGTADMDQKLVGELAASKVSAEHFLGKLQVLTEVRGQRAVLTGIMNEVGLVGKLKKKPLLPGVPRGECFLGSVLADRLGLKGDENGEVELLGRRFRVTRRLASKGPVEDIRAFISIEDAQELLGKPGRIHAIDAIGCLCPIDDFGAQLFTRIEKDIENALAGRQAVQATTYLSIAAARMQARLGADYARWLTVGALSALALLVVGFYLFSDVRERREEIGMFLAVGFGPGRLVLMFLAKLLLVALTGAALGFAVGSFGAMLLPPENLSKVAIQPAVVWPAAWAALLGAVGVSLVAGVVPILLAVRTDPAEVLRRQ